MCASLISTRNPVAVAVLAALQAATLQAQAAEKSSPPQQLPKISVGAQTEGSYKPDIASSPKYTEPLLDTPQTITIIPVKLIQDQKLLTMREILSTVPGITFGAGEGGGGYGDSITLRGFTGSSDITMDGVRDSAQYTRSDPFNLEQVEVVNGASSVYSGAGSVGGSINLVTKQARLDDFTIVSGSVGTDSFGRATADANHTLGEHSALRVNAMVHRNDVAGRDYEKFERWGLAPSIAFGLGTDTTATISYLHQSDDNIPQYGVPFFNGGPLPGVDSSNYYGYHNVDTQEIETDGLTAIIDHRFSDTFSLRNLSRVQQVDQLSVVDAVQGTWCLPNNTTPTGVTPCRTTGTTGFPVPPGQYLPSGPRGFVRDTRNRILYNQTDFTVSFATGAISHTLVSGLSFTHETFTLDTSSLFRNPDGTNPFPGMVDRHLPFMDIFNPDSRYTGPINKTLTGKTDAELDNAAIYAFDTLKLNEQWQLNAGVRYEKNEGSTTVYTVTQATASGDAPTTGGPIGSITGASAPAKNDDELFSYRAGLIYKPRENGTIYLSYGNSRSPSKPSINASCNLIATATTGANCNVAPETAIAYEIGTKWDLLDQRLAVTAAIFRNDRKNYRVNDPDPTNLTGEQALDGRARVNGVNLGVGGNILDNWAISANYAYLDSEVLQGASDFAAALGEDFTKGDPLLNVPKHSFSVWTTYELPIGLVLGYGATYQGEVYVAQHSSTLPTGPLPTAAAYTIHRVMAGYSFGPSFDLQLNVNNVLDKEYYTRIRNNGWATPGEGRLFILSANYNF